MKTASLPTHRLPWLFSPLLDLVAFPGSAAVALAMVALIWANGGLDRDTPEWLWVTAILLIDVAHVYATCFRVYFNPRDFAQRRWLYLLVPALSYLLGWAVYSESPRHFWQILAYIAVFHFVRQQYGWMALYRARGNETRALGWWIDAAAIYLATIYPLVYWHACSRRFEWFDSVSFPSIAPFWEQTLKPIYWTSLALYLIRSLYQGVHLRYWNPGKDLLVLSTVVCWYVGIVAIDSDIAFTLTNVITHGVPYLILVAWDRAKNTRLNEPAGSPQRPGVKAMFAAIRFLGLLWLLAYAEELLWDRGVWHQRTWLFGAGWDLTTWQAYYVPLLATPQLTHYILDGFIWRRKSNPEFAQRLDLNSPVPIATPGEPTSQFTSLEDRKVRVKG